MSFHNPQILWGLLAVLVPVIIHLFNFRRIRKVYFPTLAFLQEIIKKNQRRSELKHLLVLAARILAIASMVLAFAGPFFPGNKQMLELGGDRLVSIYLDNSFSMQAGTAFEGNFLKAKEQVRKVVAGLPVGARYQFITNDLKPGSSLVLSKEDLLKELNELQISPVHRTVSGMVAVQQNQMPSSSRDKAVYLIISDFQNPGSPEEENVLPDSLGQYLFVPVGSGQNVANISIDSAWFDSPIRNLGVTNDLKLVVTNHSEREVEKVSIRLFLDGVQQSAMAVDLPPNVPSTFTLPVPLRKEGFQSARLELSDYPVVFDDVYEMAWATTLSLPIAHVSGEGSGGYLSKLLGSDSSFAFRTFREGQVDYEALRRSKFIILDNLKEISSGLRSELNDFLQSGGSILVFPPSKGSLETHNQWLASFGVRYSGIDTVQSQIDRIELNHPLLQGVFEKAPEKMDLPAIYRSYPFEAMGSGTRNILYYRVDRPFLTELIAGAGHLYVCASSLDEKSTSFPNHSLFVYLTINMALRAGGQEEIAHTLQQGLMISLGDVRLEPDQVPQMRRGGTGESFIPEVLRNERGTNLIFRHNLPKAGVYELNKNEELISLLALNCSRQESETSFPALDQLKAWLTDQKDLTRTFVFDTGTLPIDAGLKNVSEGKGLELWFVVLALAFLLAEVVLLRWL